MLDGGWKFFQSNEWLAARLLPHEKCSEKFADFDYLFIDTTQALYFEQKFALLEFRLISNLYK